MQIVGSNCQFCPPSKISATIRGTFGEFFQAGQHNVRTLRLGGQPLILERFVPFQRELSILSVQDRAKNQVFYPLIENHHQDGILRLSIAPAPMTSPATTRLAEGYAARLLERFDYAGLLTIALFDDGQPLIANELAPRVASPMGRPALVSFGSKRTATDANGDGCAPGNFGYRFTEYGKCEFRVGTAKAQF